MYSQIEVADSFRKQGAYDKASQIYSTVLETEHDNFHALNGLMLCKNNLNELTDISGLLTKGTFSPKTTSLTTYKNNCRFEHRAYFNLAEKMLSMGQDYMNLTHISKTKENEIYMIQSQMQKNQYESEKYYVGGKTRKTSLLAEFILNVNGVQRNYKPYIPFTCTIIFGIYTALIIGLYILLCVKFEEVRNNISVLIVYGALILLFLGVTGNSLYKDLKIYNILRPNKTLKKELEAAVAEKNAADTDRQAILDSIKKLTWEVKKLTSKDC